MSATGISGQCYEQKSGFHKLNLIDSNSLFLISIGHRYVRAGKRHKCKSCKMRLIQIFSFEHLETLSLYIYTVYMYILEILYKPQVSTIKTCNDIIILISAQREYYKQNHDHRQTYLSVVVVESDSHKLQPIDSYILLLTSTGHDIVVYRMMADIKMEIGRKEEKMVNLRNNFKPDIFL